MPAGIKIGDLPAAGSVSGSDLIELSVSGTSKKATISQLTSLSGTVTAVTGETNIIDVATGTTTPALSLHANGVTNAKLAVMANKTIKGRKTAGSGSPEDCSTADVAAMFGTPNGSKFLADDGTLKTPASGGQVNSVVAGTGIAVNSADPANPVVSLVTSANPRWMSVDIDYTQALVGTDFTDLVIVTLAPYQNILRVYLKLITPWALASSNVTLPAAIGADYNTGTGILTSNAGNIVVGNGGGATIIPGGYGSSAFALTIPRVNQPIEQSTNIVVRVISSFNNLNGLTAGHSRFYYLLEDFT